jgi:DNA-directed RNA polymerase subunit beta'
LHLPISEEAQAEVEKYVASDKNILKPGSGEPIITHTQELILGIYYLTHDDNKGNFAGYFKSMDDVLKAYNEQLIDIKDKVVVLYDNKTIETIVGRVILNDILPEEMRFLNETIRKKQLKNLLDDVYEVAGREKTVQVADILKDYGFKYATKSAVTMNAYDFIIPEEKKTLIEEGNEKVKKIHDMWYK